MKRVALFFSFVFSMPLVAQEKPLISSAVIAYDRNKDTASALDYIGKAEEVISTKDPSTIKAKDLAKFYNYNGQINFAIHQSPKWRAKHPNALEKARENFEKLLAFEAKVGKAKYTDGVKQQMPFVANEYARRGIGKSDAKDFAGAYQDFLTTYELKKSINSRSLDSSMLYNAAIMAQNAGNNSQAIDILNELIAMGYKGVQYSATEIVSGQKVDFANKRDMNAAVSSGQYSDPTIEGDLRADLYLNVANLHLKSGDTTKYQEVVVNARKQFPSEDRLIRAELDLFLKAKEYDKAMVNLDLAIQQDPNNRVFHFVKGYIYHTELQDYDKASESYAKSIEIDPEYLEPQYMQGLIYVEQANKITEELNSLKLNETSKYDKLKAEQKIVFEKALPHFEKAHAIDANDKETMIALKEVYYKLKMYQEAKDLQAKIDAAP